MPDALRSASPLEGILVAGRHGAEAGLRVGEQRGLALSQLLARRDRAALLRRRLGEFADAKIPAAPLAGIVANDLLICAPGPLEAWVIGARREASALAADLQRAVDDAAAVFDQSHGRIVVRLEGPRAADVLAKGSSLDLHPRAFPACGGAHTLIAHISALVVQHGTPPVLDVAVPRSFASSFVAWLGEAAREYGCEVAPPAGPG